MILALDPGESTGWCAYDTVGNWYAGTLPKDYTKVWKLLSDLSPDIIIFETFQLYATHARSLIGDKFYTCEVIGIVKLWQALHPFIKLLEQGASIKKYSGVTTKDSTWKTIKERNANITNHSFDAYMHLCYYQRKERGFKNAKSDI